MNLYVDDCREPPEGFEAVARTYEDAYRLLSRYDYEVVSLDHDLGELRTGYDLACAIERGELRRPRVLLCHSQNPVGRKRIEAVIHNLERT